MLDKLHKQLTIICTLITSLILIVVSCCCFYISKKCLVENEYALFINSYNSTYSYLQSQNTLTPNWLTDTEKNTNSLIYIEDNGKPLFNEITSANNIRSEIISLVKNNSLLKHGFNTSKTNKTANILSHIEFDITTKDNTKYYISFAHIPRNNGSLEVIIAYSLVNFNNKILFLKLTFIILNIIAILALGIFSWFFTKKSIKPIEENRQKQINFIAAASHELRSPLAVIKSSCSALKLANTNEKVRFINTINSEASRMSRLVNDLLVLASADNNSWSIKYEDVELDTLLLNTFESFEYIAKNKNIRLLIKLPEEALPTYYCDKQRIEQVITILINNALSYTPECGQVLLSLALTTNHFEISIIDNGIGISSEAKAHIFERFYRADTSHTSKEHFGLGLSIANEIIKLHKGKIQVNDTPNGGTTFIIQLFI